MSHEEKQASRRIGQGLVEYVILVSLMVGVGVAATAGLRAVITGTVGEVADRIDNLEFVRGDARRGPQRRAPGGGEAPHDGARGASADLHRAVTITTCKHPRVASGQCLVCRQSM